MRYPSPSSMRYISLAGCSGEKVNAGMEHARMMRDESSSETVFVARCSAFLSPRRTEIDEGGPDQREWNDDHDDRVLPISYRRDGHVCLLVACEIHSTSWVFATHLW